MNSVTQFINDYGMIAMFFLILLEYACFPVSSEIVLPFSGAAASLWKVPFPIVIIISVIAAILGTNICYAIGYFGGSELIQKMKKRFPKCQGGIDQSLERFCRNSNYAVCFGRLIPLCRTYIAFAAGAAKQPILTFCFYSLLGITVWNTLLIGAGYYLHENWSYVEGYYQEYKFLLLFCGIFILVIFLLKKCNFFHKKS